MTDLGNISYLLEVVGGQLVRTCRCPRVTIPKQYWPYQYVTQPAVGKVPVIFWFGPSVDQLGVLSYGYVVVSCEFETVTAEQHTHTEDVCIDTSNCYFNALFWQKKVQSTFS